MSKWKWRIALSVGSLALAVGMSAVGAKQANDDRRLHPGYFYHGNLAYSPTAQWLSYRVNAPAFAITNLLRNFALAHGLVPTRWLDAHCFYFVPGEYYFLLFLLWLWIGWKFDMRLSGKSQSVISATVESLIGGIVALVLLYEAGAGLQNSFAIRGVAISMGIWGALLLLYFVSGAMKAESPARFTAK